MKNNEKLWPKKIYFYQIKYLVILSFDYFIIHFQLLNSFSGILKFLSYFLLYPIFIFQFALFVHLIIFFIPLQKFI